jgi:hypothetical protein
MFFCMIVEFAYNNSGAPTSVEDMNYCTAKVVPMYSYTKPSIATGLSSSPLTLRCSSIVIRSVTKRDQSMPKGLF